MNILKNLQDKILPRPHRKEEIMENHISPPPEVAPEQLTFSQAMEQVIAGKTIRRLEWTNESEYCLLVDGWLSIFINNKFSIWNISDGDVLAKDWIVREQ